MVLCGGLKTGSDHVGNPWWTSEKTDHAAGPFKKKHQNNFERWSVNTTRCPAIVMLSFRIIHMEGIKKVDIHL